ncbi:Rad2 nuclease [Taxawa tesnikishii (nom. ined.)]|nr:Rad2 nuclease [Dothideales sp. JES 119]
MGISGLLPLLKSIQKPCNLKEFAGQTIGVDAYGWLHRGLFVDFAMNRVRMLIHFGVKPYLVFDGDYLPSKSGTEKERAARRRESRKTGLELLRVGKTPQAHLELQKGVDVTPEMARQLIEELKKANIDYIVAPYEADSQLAYLEQQGVIQGILSEDSDLLVFGARCLLTKLDQYGDCVVINRSDFTACQEISLVGWSDAEFRCMAILSGCDYLSSIEKMGLKTAYRLIRRHKTVDRIVRSVQFEGKMKVPAGYLESYYQAETTFLYQWVYCPKAQQLVNLTQPSPDVDVHGLPYIGKYVEPRIATGVAKGDLHPHTKQPLSIGKSFRKSIRPPLRSASTSSAPDLKKHKPIDTFFRPRRIPLAELDPNSFTPSPSQQRLLDQNLASWSAEPVPTRPALLRATTSITGSAPQAVRRAVSDAWPAMGSPPKRQRLCSDNTILPLTNNATRVMAGASRFSPPLTAHLFNLWSDDSVEEAMAQLPDTTEPSSTRSKRKLTVFDDDAGGIKPESQVSTSMQSESQGTGTSMSAESQGTTTTEATSIESFDTTYATPCTSFGASFGSFNHDDSQAEKSVFSASLTSGLSALRAKYGFRADEDDPPTTVKPAKITRRSESTPSPALPRQQIPDLDFSDMDLLSSESQPVKASQLASFPKGSEDLIVPDSEGEEEEGRRC